MKIKKGKVVIDKGVEMNKFWTRPINLEAS